MAYDWLPHQESSSSTALGVAVSGVPTLPLAIEVGPQRQSSTAALALEALSSSTDGVVPPADGLEISLAPVLPFRDQLGAPEPEGE